MGKGGIHICLGFQPSDRSVVSTLAPTPIPTQVMVLASTMVLWLLFLFLFIHYVFTKMYVLCCCFFPFLSASVLCFQMHIYVSTCSTNMQHPLNHYKYIEIGRRTISALLSFLSFILFTDGYMYNIIICLNQPFLRRDRQSVQNFRIFAVVMEWRKV